MLELVHRKEVAMDMRRDLRIVQSPRSSNLGQMLAQVPDDSLDAGVLS
jgi:hypothetical protein